MSPLYLSIVFLISPIIFIPTECRVVEQVVPVQVVNEGPMVSFGEAVVEEEEGVVDGVTEVVVPDGTVIIQSPQPIVTITDNPHTVVTSKKGNHSRTLNTILGVTLGLMSLALLLIAITMCCLCCRKHQPHVIQAASTDVSSSSAPEVVTVETVKQVPNPRSLEKMK